MNDELPEWARVIAIFTLAFAFLMVVAGLAGFKAGWANDPEIPAEIYNTPDTPLQFR